MKKNIGVAMGGYSSEYEISLQSGAFICEQLDKTLFNIYAVHLLENEWYVLLEKEKYPIDKSDFSVVIQGKKIQFDCVFNMIHGTPGEDGLLQAYLELLHIPQTACDMYAAALTFNKRDCISVLHNYGIKTAVNYCLQKGDSYDCDEIIAKVGLPCFVKANRAGSSFGISKVKTKEELPAAIDYSFTEDNEIIIESFLDGTEVDVGVIKYQGKIQALPVTEIVSANEFFDYKAKYLGQSQEITPARISEADTQKVQALAKRIFKLLNVKGFARAEFIFHQGEPHFIEINTCPGMSAASIVPQQLKAAQIDYKDFFSDLVLKSIQESN